MTDKQIIIKDYFNILRDEYGRIYCIQDIGDPKSLIKAIREQNEYIQAKEQECEELKETLTEIKEIVRQEIVCDDCNFQGTDKCDSRLCTSFYLDDFCKILLQKISEFEVEDEHS